MKIQTDGLIIKQQNIGEQDKLVTALTRDAGVVRAFVRGGKNIKNSKSSPTSLLCYSALSLYKSKDAYIIDDASVKEMFFALRNDVADLALAQYFCELAAYICPSEQRADSQLSLILNALFLLVSKKKPRDLVKACVELRLASLAGFMPDLIMCRECGLYEAEQMYFSLQTGAIECKDCFMSKPFPSAVCADAGVLMAMRHIVFSEDKKVFAFSLSEEGLDKLNYITESYICRVLEHDFGTLHFYKTMKS
ncbi:MAG: DNA repair protein RecO [Ruminococcus sp.]|nr:DNA repair protein RecO [Ruminococcus sp.]